MTASFPSGASSLDEPDFSYPQTVDTVATQALDNPATAGPERLLALIELTTARTLVDSKCAPSMPALVAEQLDKATLTDADRAMLMLLEADLYKNTYLRNTRSYRHELAEGEVPDDVSLWNGELFYKRITELVDNAIRVADADDAPLDRYAASLRYSRSALQYFPTVGAFARLKKADYIDAFEDFVDMDKDALTTAEKAALSRCEPGTAPAFYWLGRIYNNDAAMLLNLYKEYARVEAARYLLLQLCDRNIDWKKVDFLSEFLQEYAINDDDDDADPYAERNLKIELIEASLKAFPGWYGNDHLRNALQQLTRPNVVLNIPTACAPEVPFTVTVETNFAEGVELTLFRLPDGLNVTQAKDIYEKGTRVSTVALTDLARDDKKTVDFTAPTPGTYAVTAELKGAKADPVVSYVDCVPFIPLSISGEGKSTVITADYVSGEPLRGVNVEQLIRSYRDNKATVKAVGKTDRNGIITYSPAKAADYGSYLRFSYKGRQYDFDKGLSVRYFGDNDDDDDEDEEDDSKRINRAVVLTSRPLYRPGETVEWVVVLGSDKDGRRQVAKGVEVTVYLKNANFDEVDNVSGLTDTSGRFYGSFILPKDQLTGTWYLNVDWDNEEVDAPIEVSDFKTPTIYTEIVSTERNIPTEGSVRLTGRVMTFSGMPVAGAAVEAQVYGARRVRWFKRDRKLGEVSAVSDAAGMYTLDVDSALLAREFSSAGPYNDFNVNIVVTAPDASTGAVSTSFTRGKPYVLAAEMSRDNVDTSLPVPVVFSAYNGMGDTKPVEISWSVSPAASKGDVVAQGTATTGGKASLDLSSLAAGRYVMSIAATDSTLADPVAKALRFTAYNIARNDVPDTPSGVFVPMTDITAAGGHADVAVGVNADHAVYVIVSEKGKIRRPEVVHLKKGFNRLPVDFADKCEMLLLSVDKGQVSRTMVQLRVPPTPPAQIVAESFRDRVVPGTTENWRLRLIDTATDKTYTDAAAVVTIYNKALETLVGAEWPAASYSRQPWYRSIDVRWYSVFDRVRRLQAKLMTQSLSQLILPEFRYLEEYFAAPRMAKHVLYGYRASSGRPSTLSMSMADDAQEEMMDYAMAKNATVGAESADEVEAEEAAVTADSGNAADAPDTFEYRLPEVLQAVWAPALVADKEGNIDLCFTVPNANATWQLRSMAWSRDLHFAEYAFECLANKPVMVQPNLPRFLRRGDRATIVATVFNNGDDTAVVTTEVTLSTGVSHSSVDTIAAKASAIVAVEVEVPVDADRIEYTVKSTAGGFADGERALIPVLASESTVVESTEFYLNAGDDKPCELTVNVPAGAAVTLQYCQNPVWTIVKAMRSIAGDQPSTSTGLGIRIFSALTGRHLINGNPEIAEVLRQWRENPSEEALTSMLARNEDLKLLLLDQTPWAQAATHETARMEALASTTDWQAPLDAAVAALGQLQNGDGGFAWGSWAPKSSRWSTESVLMHCAIARSLGMLDSRDAALTGMLAKAFRYLERQDLAGEHPATTDLTLTLIAALMPELKPLPEGKLLIGRTVDNVALKWKEYDTVSKAWAVLILKANGRHAEAAAVLESIRQFGVVRPDMGMCFPSVTDMRSYATIIQAFAAMDAPRELIDAMRQWVIMQAQASDDIAALNPEYIIAAMLGSGTVWTSVPVSQCVTVDGKALDIEGAEAGSGYFARHLPATGGKMHISVSPNGVTPSYGSVVTVSRSKSSQVKARPGRDLSITKRVLAKRNGGWVETDEFVAGERLLVQLTVKAKRQLEYVNIDDCRPATFEPVEQLSVYTSEAGLFYYRENLDASTRLYIGYMPAGTYVLSYEVTANNAGTFTTGIATLQSQYAPELTAHSGGKVITVK